MTLSQSPALIKGHAVPYEPSLATPLKLKQNKNTLAQNTLNQKTKQRRDSEHFFCRPRADPRADM